MLVFQVLVRLQIHMLTLGLHLPPSPAFSCTLTSPNDYKFSPLSHVLYYQLGVFTEAKSDTSRPGSFPHLVRDFQPPEPDHTCPRCGSGSGPL